MEDLSDSVVHKRIAYVLYIYNCETQILWRFQSFRII